RAGTTPVLIGLAAGSLAFAAGDYILSRNGGSDRKRSGGQQAGGAAMAIALGAMLDGIPDSAAIGVTLLGGCWVGVAMVVAVFLSNIPESMSAAVGLRKAGRSVRWILGLWLAVTAVSAVAAALGYAVLGNAPESTVAAVQAFAAGA